MPKFNIESKFKTSDSRATLKRMIELRPSRNTSLIDITVYSDDKAEAATIANAIAEVYTDYRLTERAHETDFERHQGLRKPNWTIRIARSRRKEEEVDKLRNDLEHH